MAAMNIPRGNPRPSYTGTAYVSSHLPRLDCYISTNKYRSCSPLKSLDLSTTTTMTITRRPDLCCVLVATPNYILEYRDCECYISNLRTCIYTGSLESPDVAVFSILNCGTSSRRCSLQRSVWSWSINISSGA
jgi:hypothetical protein